ncbi:MAG TPA: HK97 family phage prohead protease, partial [Acidimicrobiia bacterium]
EGERYKKDKKKKRDLPDAYRPATDDDVPEGRACGNCMFFDESDVAPDGRARCTKWDEYVAGGWYCNAWEPMEEGRAAPDALRVGDFVSWNSSGGRARGRIERVAREGSINVPDSEFTINASESDPAALIRVWRPSGDAWRETDRLVGHRFSTLTKIDPLPEDEEDDRDVDLSPPAYIRAAARQGLDFHADGLSGDGVVPRTIREARDMAEGRISEDKVVRAAAWAARHRPDLEAAGARPDEDGYPTPGAVAHLLWGIPTGARYSDAVAWFDRKSEQVKADRSVMMVTPVTPRAKNSKAEFRSFEGEIRTDGDGNTFVGYAAKFNVPSEPLPFIERIAPGAFGKSLRQRSKDVRLYINHNSDMVLASKRSGTLRLSEDDTGLRVEADLPDTTAARDLRALMTSGVVSTMSFGFTVPRGGDKWSGDGSERTLTGINLHEVSVVTGFPAYPQTEAAVRSLEKLSERTGIAVEEINEVLDALADGDSLDPAKAELLMNAIKEATPAPEVEENTANLLALKKKQVDLLAKKW